MNRHLRIQVDSQLKDYCVYIALEVHKETIATAEVGLSGPVHGGARSTYCQTHHGAGGVPEPGPIRKINAGLL
nr:hypothetical protein [Granulosicoccus sp.]